MPSWVTFIIEEYGMPKYQFNEDAVGPRNTALFCIANELAEANRLKRLELSHFQPLYMTKHENVKSDTLLPKDLEDKA